MAAESAMDSDEEINRILNSDVSDSDTFDGFSIRGDSDISDFIVSSSDSESESDGSDEENPVVFDHDFQYGDCPGELHDVIVHAFREETGPVLHEGFDVDTATPKDYFHLVFKPEILRDIVRFTNDYARWKGEKNGREDTVWYDVTENEMSAYLGMLIFMGINQLPSYKDFWSKDIFLGNEGIKSVMSVKRYEKITEYFHVSDRRGEDNQGPNNIDKLYKVRPVIDMAKEHFQAAYKPSKNSSIDEAMIKWSGRLSYKQYLPAKPIKRGIKVWMRCDADTAYLNDFDIYLGKSTENSAHGLGYDVVTNLTSPLQDKNHWVFFDNYFTSVHLCNDLLGKGIYSCGTVRMNRRGFPDDLKRLKLKRGESKIRQQGNLTACVWQDKKPVAFLSTLSDPTVNVDVIRRQGRNQVRLTQPHAGYIYNQKMNGVDRHDQLRTTYSLGRDSKKAWKYIFYFIVNCAIVNAFIIYNGTTQRQHSKKRYTHLDFRRELGHELIAGFNGRKRKAGEVLQQVHNNENFNGHENVKLQTRRRCRVHLNRKERKETVFGCRTCNVHLCKYECHLVYHTQANV